MPSFNIHLAIGKRYIEKHEIKQKEEFLQGTIAPDFGEKEKTHYTKQSLGDSLIEHLENKVSIEEFLKVNKVDTDYQKGILLHLLTDKLFYTTFFSTKYLENVTYQKFCEDLYFSYDKTNPYLEEKYQFECSEELSKKIKQNIQASRKSRHLAEGAGEDILPLVKLDAFIEEVSEINLEKLLKKE